VIVGIGACGVASGATGASGIAGRVVAGPTCPVESVPPSPRCAPRPIAATLRIHRAQSGSPATTVQSGKDGRFRVGLSPGTYVVRPLSRSGSPFPRPPAPSRVHVTGGRLTHITITYDTGIR
jgi:hypothetical protein